MSATRRIAKNTVFLYIANVITLLIFLFLSILIARELGDVTLGKFSFAFSLSIISGIFISLGYDTLIIRDVARDWALAPKYLGNIISIKAILSLIVFGLMALIISLMHYPSDTTGAVLIFLAYAVITAFTVIFKVTFRAFERMEYEALSESTGRLITFFLGVAALFLGYGLLVIVGAFLIGSMCDLVISYFFCSRKFAKPKPEIDLDFWKKITKAAIPIGFLSLTSVIYIRTDTVMLSIMKGDAVVGWYTAAYNLILALNQMPFIFTTAVFPMMSRLFVSSTNSLRLTYEKMLNYLFIVGLPLALGTMLLSGRIILLFYGEQFIESIAALQIVSWNIVVFFLYFPLGMLLVSINKQNQMAITGGICALLNIVLNLILIPPLSYIGAGIATLATQVILFGFYFYFAAKQSYRLQLHKIAAKPIIASAVMAVFLYFNSQLNLAVLIIVGIVIYFTVFLLIKGFTREDWQLLGSIIRRQ
ncbi:MAG: hypothetical protein A2144_00330 [Chloroflexi bacterium RBG_16_50_9]|nr:MAG: hypothetical protein A2144_00330 [Chloroflexi bacterium RBG_16_50_9]